MKYRTRTYYSAEQKAEMWDRWQRGESLHSIARLFDRFHTSVRGILAATGGIRPRLVSDRPAIQQQLLRLMLYGHVIPDMEENTLKK
jgi:hypothetical protein